MRLGGLIAGVVLGVLAAAPPAIASGWSIESAPSPAGAIRATLTGVSCTGARACSAIGTYGASTNGTGLAFAESWNGRVWSITPGLPMPSGAAWIALSGLSCTSARSCTAVGNYQRSGSFTLAEVWDGTSWSIQRTLTPAYRDSALDAVSCTSARSCLAVSEGPVERWNGTAWSYTAQLPMPSWADLLQVGGVSCTSVTWCMAVGQASWMGEDPSQQHAPWASVWRWNGKRWSLQTFPGLDHLSAVSCASDRACIAVGRGMAERWNGTKWFRVRLNGGADLSSVSCTSPRACTAVGRTSAGALVERWNGARWSSQSTPRLPSGRGGHLDSVSCTSVGSCTAAGGYTNGSGRAALLVERWTP